jgi:hypothetical protein
MISLVNGQHDLDRCADADFRGELHAAAMLFDNF